MLKQLKKSKSEGFTIIEVMIVLAIAGLILLIVFLAVPALQRNSRNTQAKNEASNIVGAVNEFVTNNDGKLPDTAADATTVLEDSNVSNTENLTIEDQGDGSAPTVDTAILVKGAKCTASVTTGGFDGDVTDAGASRQFAVLFAMEDRAGDATGCIDS